MSRATLYAYVSRGRIRSELAPGAVRRSRYSRDDVERLRARTRERRNPERAAEQALHWGLPILESSITLIGDGRIYYRGRDAAELARTSSARRRRRADLDWQGRRRVTRRAAASHGPRRHEGRKGHAVRRACAGRARARLRRPIRSRTTCVRIRSRARAGGSCTCSRSVAAGSSSEPTIDAALAASWRVSRHVDLIRAALILCADHELNVSAFTARCVASAGSSPYGVVLAGLSALEGTKHGGTTVRMEAFWDALRRSARLRGGFAERLRRGEAIEGFGHPLYPRGDPRAAVLLARLPKTKGAKYARDLVAAARDVLGEAPNVDFALVALARALGLPDGAALTLFAIGRTIGWVGHAIEQYEQNAIIRPRAKYVGENPPA